MAKSLRTRSRPSAPVRRRAPGSWFLMALALVMLTLGAGCATAGEGRSSSDRNHITAEELDNLTVPVGNLYAAVELLRPMWLQARGGGDTEIAVAQGSTYVGTTESLRQIPVAGVRSLSFLDASRATSYVRGLGSRHVHGAIVIEFGSR